ncbi:variant erythrocyte surface antigen-1 family protein [Babesia caballi]|uniref:Variant erythrocyte surface antigen-1 family protein n=1 Tax=Babesia caballi TaxID=5871 RepID=A0AAV4M193_BABCB|nr:variant erythrocyte surface antigen-1 family protein [Babesia caballi]
MLTWLSQSQLFVVLPPLTWGSLGCPDVHSALSGSFAVRELACESEVSREAVDWSALFTGIVIVIGAYRVSGKMGESQKSQLTDWPEDLKDVVDWFLRVGGKDTGNQNNDKSGALKNAVYQLKGKDVLENALGSGDLPGLFIKVTKGLQQLIGYDGNGNHDLTEDGIGRKNSYASSYGSAKWKDKLDQPTSPEAKKAAKIFLCYMPVLYLCLIYLYWKCKLQYGGWGSETINGNQSGLSLFMINMGFPSTQLNGNKLGSEIANLLVNEPNGLDELKNAQSSSLYSDYLDKVTQYGQSQITHPINCPLYALYKASTAYLKSRFQEEKPTNQSLEEIREKIRTFHISCNSAPELKGAIGTFISICLTKPQKSNHPSPSSTSHAGPVAGTLTTLGLGGGATAAYLFNLGGAKTIVNGLLKIS